MKINKLRKDFKKVAKKFGELFAAGVYLWHQFTKKEKKMNIFSLTRDESFDISGKGLRESSTGSFEGRSIFDMVEKYSGGSLGRSKISTLVDIVRFLSKNGLCFSEESLTRMAEKQIAFLENAGVPILQLRGRAFTREVMNPDFFTNEIPVEKRYEIENQAYEALKGAVIFEQ